MHSGGGSYGGRRGDEEGGLKEVECLICDDVEKKRTKFAEKMTFLLKNAKSIIFFF